MSDLGWIDAALTSARPQAVAALLRYFRNLETAEEAFQESLATLWRKLRAVSRHPNPPALVLRIAVQAACDQLRAHHRRRGRFAPFDEADGAEVPSPGEAVVERERREAILDAVARLNRRQAAAFLMRALHGEPYETIAGALGCSEATARVHVMRARETLRRRIAMPRGRSGAEESP